MQYCAHPMKSPILNLRILNCESTHIVKVGWLYFFNSWKESKKEKKCRYRHFIFVKKANYFREKFRIRGFKIGDLIWWERSKRSQGFIKVGNSTRKTQISIFLYTYITIIVWNSCECPLNVKEKIIVQVTTCWPRHAYAQLSCA